MRSKISFIFNAKHRQIIIRIIIMIIFKIYEKWNRKLEKKREVFARHFEKNCIHFTTGQREFRYVEVRWQQPDGSLNLICHWTHATLMQRFASNRTEWLNEYHDDIETEIKYLYKIPFLQVNAANTTQEELEYSNIT